MNVHKLHSGQRTNFFAWFKWNFKMCVDFSINASTTNQEHFHKLSLKLSIRSPPNKLQHFICFLFQRSIAFTTFSDVKHQVAQHFRHLFDQSFGTTFNNYANSNRVPLYQTANSSKFHNVLKQQQNQF